jgi:fatty acid desaturase
MQATDFLSRDEIRILTERSNMRGAWMVLSNWLLIAAIFALTALWTNPLTLLLALLLLGGRQLGLSVIMHEAGHKTLFRSQRLNSVVGQWFAALPVLGDCDAYAASHREHHRLAGTGDDPDLPNYRNYPISKASFRRKIARDISGSTGSKLLLGLLSGAGNRIMMRTGEDAGALPQGLTANLILFLILLACNIPAFYLLWLAAYLSSYPLVARIRQVAEHGNVVDLYDPDPRANTRSTCANWIERLILCPNNVGLHIEHHLLPSVPAYRLPALHQHLLDRGFYDAYPESVAKGYWSVIKRVVPELDSNTAARA